MLDNFPNLFNWLESNPSWFYAILTVSVVTFIASLILIPWFIIQMPEDYFVSRHRHSSKLQRLHPALYLLVRIGKNLLGLFLFFTGLVMFFLPGQGILTMLIGVTLTDFPGKYRVERWFIEKPAVIKTINWIRRKAKKPMLINPHSLEQAGSTGRS